MFRLKDNSDQKEMRVTKEILKNNKSRQQLLKKFEDVHTVMKQYKQPIS